MTRRLLIVAHAPSPNTRRLPDAAVEGARSAESQNLEVVAVSPFEAGPEEAWLEGAQEHPGSWWPDWHRWLRPKSGAKVAARVPGAGGLAALEAAPGSYVKVRAD